MTYLLTATVMWIRYCDALYTLSRLDPNTSARRFSVGMEVHTVVSMTWVWQELSEEGMSWRELELLKTLKAWA